MNDSVSNYAADVKMNRISVNLVRDWHHRPTERPLSYQRLADDVDDDDAEQKATKRFVRLVTCVWIIMFILIIFMVVSFLCDMFNLDPFGLHTYLTAIVIGVDLKSSAQGDLTLRSIGISIVLMAFTFLAMTIYVLICKPFDDDEEDLYELYGDASEMQENEHTVDTWSKDE